MHPRPAQVSLVTHLLPKHDVNSHLGKVATCKTLHFCTDYLQILQISEKICNGCRHYQRKSVAFMSVSMRRNRTRPSVLCRKLSFAWSFCCECVKISCVASSEDPLRKSEPQQQTVCDCGLFWLPWDTHKPISHHHSLPSDLTCLLSLLPHTRNNIPFMGPLCFIF